MVDIDFLIENNWTTEHMQNQKDLAYKLKNFDKNDFVNEFNSEEESDIFLEKFYQLYNFVKPLEENKLNKEYQQKVDEFYSALEELDKDNDNICKNYISKKRFIFENQLESISDQHIKTLKNTYSKNNKLKDIEFLIKDWNSSVAYLGQKKSNKNYNKYLTDVKSQYNDISSLIRQIKKEEDLKEHELEELLEKEKNTEKMMKEVLYNLKYKKLPKQKLSLIAKIIAGIAIVVTLYEGGQLAVKTITEFEDWWKDKRPIEQIFRPEKQTQEYSESLFNQNNYFLN